MKLEMVTLAVEEWTNIIGERIGWVVMEVDEGYAIGRKVSDVFKTKRQAIAWMKAQGIAI